MKLYFAKAPHSSLPVQIILEEIGIAYETVWVDLEIEPTHELLAINPVGGVPVLVLNDGQILTEISAILNYLADEFPTFNLAPKWGFRDRYRLLEWLSYISTELHKGFWPLGFLGSLSSFPEASDQLSQLVFKNLELKLDIVAEKLGSNDYALTGGYSVADPYLYTMLIWAQRINLSLSPWPNLMSYFDRIAQRPATLRAIRRAAV